MTRWTGPHKNAGLWLTDA